MKYSKKPSFGESPLVSPVGRVAARVLAIDNQGTVVASGTCVRIGVGLYLSAKHVIEDFVDSFGHESFHLNCSIWVAHLYDGEGMEIWALTNVWTGTNTDISILRAIPHVTNKTPLAAVNTVGLDLAPPPIGSRVSAYGFCESKGTFKVEKNTVSLDLWGTPVTAVGEIREIHDQTRDQYLLNFPCFRVNARFDGGMSGGPIFTDNGSICGVVCKGYKLEDPELESISYGATLWPALCLPITVDMRTGMPCERYCLLDLARTGYIHVANAHHLQATSSNEGFSGIYTPGA
jgi:hypothetical protein